MLRLSRRNASSTTVSPLLAVGAFAALKRLEGALDHETDSLRRSVSLSDLDVRARNRLIFLNELEKHPKLKEYVSHVDFNLSHGDEVPDDAPDPNYSATVEPNSIGPDECENHMTLRRRYHLPAKKALERLAEASFWKDDEYLEIEKKIRKAEDRFEAAYRNCHARKLNHENDCEYMFALIELSKAKREENELVLSRANEVDALRLELEAISQAAYKTVHRQTELARDPAEFLRDAEERLSLACDHIRSVQDHFLKLQAHLQGLPTEADRRAYIHEKGDWITELDQGYQKAQQEYHDAYDDIELVTRLSADGCWNGQGWNSVQAEIQTDIQPAKIERKHQVVFLEGSKKVPPPKPRRAKVVTKTQQSSAAFTERSKATLTLDPESTATLTPQSKATLIPRLKATVTPQSKSTVTPQSKVPITPQSKATVTQQSKASLIPRLKAPRLSQLKATVTQQLKATFTPQPKAKITPQSKATITQQSKPTITPQSNSTIAQESKATVTQQSKATLIPRLKATVTQRLKATVTQRLKTPPPTHTSVNGCYINGKAQAARLEGEGPKRFHN